MIFVTIAGRISHSDTIQGATKRASESGNQEVYAIYLSISSLVHFHTSLCTQVRLQSQTAVLSGGEKYSVDQFALTDIRNVLKDQQEGIQVHLSTDLHAYNLKLNL